MRHWLAAILVVLCIAPSAQAGDNWTTFTDNSGTFSLSVPETPTFSAETTMGNNGRSVVNAKYLIDLGSVALLATISDFSGMNTDPAAALDLAVKGVQTESRNLLSDQSVMLDGHPGRDVKLTDADGDAFTDRIFFFDDHLYQFITVATKEAGPDQFATAERYSVSLHFLR